MGVQRTSHPMPSPLATASNSPWALPVHRRVRAPCAFNRMQALPRRPLCHVPAAQMTAAMTAWRKPRRRWMGMRSAWPLLVAMHGQHRCANWRAIEARHMGSLPITQNAIVQMLRLALVNFYVGFVPLPVTVGKRLSLA